MQHLIKRLFERFSGPKQVIFVYVILSLVWLLASDPLFIDFASHPFIIVGIRTLYTLVTALIIYTLLEQQKNLRVSKAQYDHLFNTLLEPILIHRHGRIIDANQHAVQLLDANSRDELVGKSILGFVHPTYLAEVKDRISRLNRGVSTEPLEEQFITLTGRVIDVQVLAAPTILHGKRVIEVFIRDITLRKRNEAAVHESEQRLRTLINSIPDHICFLGPDGRWIEANNRLLQGVGVPEDTYRGKTAVELIDVCKPEMQDFFIKNSAYPDDVFDVPTGFETELALDDGTIEVHEVRRVPVKDCDGSSMGIVVVARNVTKERAAIRQLTESEQRYRELNRMHELILASAVEGIIGIDINGNAVFCNAAVSQLTGYERDQFIGQPIHQKVHCGSEDCVDTAECPMCQAMYNESVWHGTDQVFYRKDGTAFSVECTISPLVDEGQMIGAVIVFRDITDRKHAEELLLQSEKLATVGELAAGIAHEVRNPLTALKGFLQMMNQADGGNQYYCGIMLGELSRIESIVNEFLVLAKPTALEVDACLVDDLLGDTIALLRAEASLRGVDITTEITAGMPAVICDRNRIKQVLVNLIKNAIEAIPEDDGTVRIFAHSDDNSQQVTMRIVDNGMGIPEEHLAKLGNPFYTTKETGTGLGLLVSQRIIRSHGGQLQVRSQVGVGTEVEITLPIRSHGLSLVQRY